MVHRANLVPVFNHNDIPAGVVQRSHGLTCAGSLRASEPLAVASGGLALPCAVPPKLHNTNG